MSSDDPELPGLGAGTRTLVLCRSRYARLSTEPSVRSLQLRDGKLHGVKNKANTTVLSCFAICVSLNIDSCLITNISMAVCTCLAHAQSESASSNILFFLIVFLFLVSLEPGTLRLLMIHCVTEQQPSPSTLFSQACCHWLHHRWLLPSL